MKKTLTVLTMTMILVTFSSAQWVVTSGPFGGAVRSLVANGSLLFAGTDGVGVSSTTNGGTNWAPLNSGLPSNPSVQCLLSVGANLYTGIATQGVYLSTNNGTSWTAVNTGLTNFYVKALAAIGGNLFAATYGGVFLSTNAGTTWAAVNNGLTNTTVMSLVASGTTLLAGTDGGGVFVSTNNGTNWTASNSGFPSPATTTVHCLLVNGSNVFAGYHRGVVLTTNNGSTWTTINTGFPNATINVMSLVASGSNLFAATSGSGVYRSTNNGANWSTFSTGLSNMTIMSITVVGSELYAGTFGSGVWRILVPTSVKEVVSTSPASFALEQNYPNPFNPTTNIRFSVQVSGLVVLKVFNLLGSEVATLVNENLNAGSYETTFAAGSVNGLASGTYFYRLQSGASVQTKKLVLMK